MFRLPAKNPWYGHGVKRALDIILALLALILLSPLLVLITVLLVIFLPGRPVFRQERVGYKCRIFRIYKFRTMTEAVGEDGKLLPDEARTPWLGRLLRSSSLDELPELINILCGDMSFIGPRPWVPTQMETFSAITQQVRMSVRPGLSGLSQISGRNNLTFRERASLDLRYIRHLCLSLDVVIFLLTFWKVIKREGIYPHPENNQHLPPKDPDTKGLRANSTRRCS